MPTAMMVEDTKAIVLKYADKGTYKFDKIALAATDAEIYNVAEILNSFQKDQATQVIKLTTFIVM
jgi:hypothetical protein